MKYGSSLLLLFQRSLRKSILLSPSREAIGCAVYPMISGIHMPIVAVMMWVQIIDIAVRIGEPAALQVSVGIHIIPEVPAVPKGFDPSARCITSVRKFKFPAYASIRSGLRFPGSLCCIRGDLFHAFSAIIAFCIGRGADSAACYGSGSLRVGAGENVPRRQSLSRGQLQRQSFRLCHSGLWKCPRLPPQSPSW